MRTCALLAAMVLASSAVHAADPPAPADTTTIGRKVMCGYQGWFRCPGDAADMGWVHWSRNGKRIAPDTLTFEMWPDMTEYGPGERFPAPGFTYPDGKPAELFSSDNAATVRRHFEWMRDYGIDGAWVQQFVVDLPGGPAQGRYPSRTRTLGHIRAAAKETGRTWAITYDVTGMPGDRTFDVLTREWKKMVDDGITKDPRYLHEGGKPVVQVWGYYRSTSGNALSAAVGQKLIDFFKADGPYRAYVVGGGDWDWRRNPDPEWKAVYASFDAYMPWNVGNFHKDAAGVKRAATGYWADDIRECKKLGVRWIPVVYPGFSWDNLQKKPAGTTIMPRRKGEFLWEQFHELTKHGIDTACVAMFDEVDEGTAIFKVTNAPPTQAHFVGYEGMPSDWYLRLVGEGGRMIRGERPAVAAIPLKP